MTPDRAITDADSELSGPTAGLAAGTDNTLGAERQALLRMAGMDWRFVRGEGVWMFDESGRRFLDAYAQYGVLALGHNHAAVKSAIQRALDDNMPAMVQPYPAREAEKLAQVLCDLAGKTFNRCVLTSSGAETVEAALKLARMFRRRPLIVSTLGSYHGKTMGALAASDRLEFSAQHFQESAGFIRVPFGDIEALAECFQRRGDEIAAFIVEPIQGERGVFLPPRGYLTAVRELCDTYGIVFIADEIQTGLFRTGMAFASNDEAVTPDIMLVAKALGGGIFPLGACLARSSVWDADFALAHSSTFANNNMASSVALAVLGELLSVDFQRNLMLISAQLTSGLATLARRFPATIADVRGRGLMHAIELRAPPPGAGYFLNYLHHQGLSAYMLASVLARAKGVLVLPALNNSNVIRIAPPLIARAEHISQILDALHDVLTLWETHSAGTIIQSAVGLFPVPGAAPTLANVGKRSPLATIRFPAQPRRVADPPLDYAFIIHPTVDADIILNDPSFARFSTAELGAYQDWCAQLPPGVVCEIPAMVSLMGKRVRGALIGLPLLPAQMARRGRHAVSHAIGGAVELARTRGAKIVGLGAFTSIYTRKGASVVGRGPLITTGNILTAGMTFKALLERLRAQDRSLADCRVGVVGARGSIGSLIAQLAVRCSPREITLIGNPHSNISALDGLANLLKSLGSSPLVCSADISLLENCDVIISASSSPSPVLDGVAVRPGTIICDVARPFDASTGLRARRDITIIDSGLVRLPGRPERIGAGNVQGHPAGIALACLSETILLAMAGATRDYGIGENVAVGEVDAMLGLAAQHGFTLAPDDLAALPESSPSFTLLSMAATEAMMLA